MVMLRAVHAQTRDDGTRVLLAGLCLVALTAAVLQTGVVPVLDTIARQLGAAPVAVSWVLTANLLAAAAATPVVGRLADLYSKKTVLLSVLGMVLAGSLLAATTSSLALLVVGRVLQAGSFALFPVCVSILRDEIPADRLVRSMVVLSAMLGLGGGLGLVLTGVLSSGDGDYHVVFWLHTALAAVVAVAVAEVVPARPRRGTGSVDWLGAAGLAAGLSLLLLALTQGRGWGWDSPRIVGVLLAGVAVLLAWWWWSGRAAHPLVSTAMLARTQILLTNIATVLVGMGLYVAFLGLTDFVEAPVSGGYGFGAGVLDTSLVFLLPGAIAASVTAVLGGRYIDRFGARTVGIWGAGAGLLGFVMLAAWHTSRWELIAAYVLANAYISLAYGALPVLVVREVGPDETAVATGVNAIARTVGSSLGAAMVAVLLAPARTGVIAERDFIAVFMLGALTAIGAMVFLALTRGPVECGRHANWVGPQQLSEGW